MKKSLLISTFVAASIAAVSVNANAAQQEPLTQWEKAGVLSSTIVVGTIAGGPVGLVLGLAAGDWINNTWDKAITTDELSDHNKQISDQLLATEANNDQLQQNVTALNEQVKALSTSEAYSKQLALSALQRDLLFTVNQSRLDLTNQARVEQIADYLKAHPGSAIVISGHTDPSGSNDYNNTLAQKRADSVMETLVSMGVDKESVTVQALGSSQAGAKLGEADKYAKDRRVSLELISNTADTGPALAMQF